MEQKEGGWACPFTGTTINEPPKRQVMADVYLHPVLGEIVVGTRYLAMIMSAIQAGVRSDHVIKARAIGRALFKRHERGEALPTIDEFEAEKLYQESRSIEA